MNYITSDEFKSKCMGIIEEVHETEKPVVVTKEGVPFVSIIPYGSSETSAEKKLFGVLKGTITITGDIMKPIEELLY